MARLRVKVCGITRLQDALGAVSCGVDALGFIFYPKSSRYIDPLRAAEIVACLPPFVTKIGVFVNEKPNNIASILKQVSLSALQFHGQEVEQDCISWGLPYLKAIPMGQNRSLENMISGYSRACGYLLDSYNKEKFGGTGEVFDWNLVKQNMHKPIVLAGGIGPDNVQRAYDKCMPYAVDVNSGVEERPGVKNESKIRKLMSIVGGLQ